MTVLTLGLLSTGKRDPHLTYPTTVVGLRRVQHKAGVHFGHGLTGRKELFDFPAQKAHPRALATARPAPRRGQSLSGGQWALAEAPRAPVPAPLPSRPGARGPHSAVSSGGFLSGTERSAQGGDGYSKDQGLIQSGSDTVT